MAPRNTSINHVPDVEQQNEQQNLGNETPPSVSLIAHLTTGPLIHRFVSITDNSASALFSVEELSTFFSGLSMGCGAVNVLAKWWLSHLPELAKPDDHNVGLIMCGAGLGMLCLRHLIFSRGSPNDASTQTMHCTLVASAAGVAGVFAYLVWLGTFLAAHGAEVGSISQAQ